jgi:hypothetical protein
VSEHADFVEVLVAELRIRLRLAHPSTDQRNAGRPSQGATATASAASCSASDVTRRGEVLPTHPLTSSSRRLWARG